MTDNSISIDEKSEAVTAGRGSSLHMVVAAAFIGTVIEWYDFFLYGTAAALVFNKLFFPNISAFAGTMAAFATYAVGFFARPLGGILFGYLGDRRGRKATLVWTLSVTGGATFLIGCLPTYKSVGVLAPVLLMLLRFVQGIAVGGEWGGAALMTVEHGANRRRGFYGSFVQAGVPVGLILATGIFRGFSSMSDTAFAWWGWRAPFWAGILLTGVGFFIRTHVAESPLFKQEQSRQAVLRNPLVAAFVKDWKTILLVIGARIAENASFYIFSVFILTYATVRLSLPKSMVLNGVLIGSAVESISIIFFGYLSDRIGRRSVYMFGSICLIAFAFPFFKMLDTKETVLIWIAIGLALGVAHAAMYAPQASFFTESFGTNVRFSGASIGYQLSAPLAGGLAPIIATSLLEIGHGNAWLISVYLVGIGMISLISVFLLKETRKANISESVVINRYVK